MIFDKHFHLTPPTPLAKGGETECAMTIAVIGAGTMGRGIAETAATQSLPMVVVELSATQRESAAAQMRTSIEKGIRRGRITAVSADDVLARVTWSDNIADIANADFVIEAVPETESLKLALFADLDRLCRPGVVLASNTSSISITRLAAATKRPELVVGMHFFNPVPVMAPVEIVRGDNTSDDTIAATKALAEQLGKQAFVVRDRPGFVVNRVLMPLINEAVFALQDEIADAATIDSLMKLGCNHPMGPLALADLVGLDVCLSILNVLHAGLHDEKFRPCPLLAEKVAAGELGRKTGRGFFVYSQ